MGTGELEPAGALPAAKGGSPLMEKVGVSLGNDGEVLLGVGVVLLL